MHLHYIVYWRLYDPTFGASTSALTKSSCRAAIQFGHHAAQSHRRIRLLTEAFFFHNIIFKCSIPSQTRQCLTYYIHSSLAQLKPRRFCTLRTEARMRTSEYLLQALFHQLSHATLQALESKSETLFQRPGKRSFIELYHQQPERQKQLRSPAFVLDDGPIPHRSSVCPSIIDQSWPNSLEDPPPTYDNPPGLLRRDISDLRDVQRIEAVRALITALSCADTHGEQGN